MDTDGFVSDVVMCDSCGTLVAKGPSPCAGCGAGVDQIRTQLYAGCEHCKGLVQRVTEGVTGSKPRLKRAAVQQDPKESPCFFICCVKSVSKKATAVSDYVGHIIEEPGGIKHMVDC